VRVDKAATTSGESPYERLRRHGALRSALIAYGIAAFVYFFPRPHPSADGEPMLVAATGALQMLLVGLALQIVSFAIRKIIMRYERKHGIEGFLSPLALFIFELIVDAVTVLLFALATFRGLASFNSGL
jgi:hypothetical protein